MEADTEMQTSFEAINGFWSMLALMLIVVGICMLLWALVRRPHTPAVCLAFGLVFALLTGVAASSYYLIEAFSKLTQVLTDTEFLRISYKAQPFVITYVAIFGGLSANMLAGFMLKGNEPFWGIDFEKEKTEKADDIINIMITIYKDKAEKMPETECEKYKEGLKDAIALCEILQGMKVKIKDRKFAEKIDQTFPKFPPKPNPCPSDIGLAI